MHAHRLSLHVLTALTCCSAAYLCAACGDGGQACTEEAVASVRVTVEAQDGSLVEDARVTYATEREAPQMCEDAGQGSYICGYEVSGDLTITAQSFNRARMTSDTVTVTQGPCHVETRDVVLRLPDAP